MRLIKLNKQSISNVSKSLTQSLVTSPSRQVSSSVSSSQKCLILGCHEQDGKHKLTPSGESLNERLSGKISGLLEKTDFKAKVGKYRTFYDVEGSEFDVVTVSGLGTQVEEIDTDDLEHWDGSSESVRNAVGLAMKSFSSATEIHVDACGRAHAAAEGAHLADYKFDKFKSKKNDGDDDAKSLSVHLYNGSSQCQSSWSSGQIMADCQNFARDLMNTPSNYKYPELFVDIVQRRLAPYANIELIAHDKQWAADKKMDCFLSVAAGSEHAPQFLELHYRGSDGEPVVLVGKGVTFDSGGISIKPSGGMAAMKGDMGGAACVLASIEAAARMNLSINLTVLVPLVENMPSGSATNPGDVFTAMNGKSVEVDNTDAEGRMILADALCYADEFKPRAVIDMATLTGAMDVALGGGAAGCFTTSNALWETLYQASYVSGDRLWRMPLYEHYTTQMKCSETADLRNTQQKARSAGSSTAAAFLKEFTTTKSWAHLDIAGVMDATADAKYLGKGMTGRPARTIMQALISMQDS